jgi:cyclomaltodextrinase / maltogenic alpha-amylase / neopullulanase
MSHPQTPAWVKDAVFYQIFPDRFAKSPLVSKPSHLEDWDAPPTHHGYKGGDLPGIVDHLDYLHDLGITAIYCNPIFWSGSNHRYQTYDYFQIDPMLGGNAAFTDLREATRARGMRLILDGVFNHCGRGQFYFHDILENGPASPWVEWFTITGWPLSPYGEEHPANYSGWWNLRGLPRWNTDHPEVREYIMGVAEHWMRQGIDGWRLDVPDEITAPDFWEEFRHRVRAINPEAYIVGEIWGDDRAFVGGDRFDAVMNYRFTELMLAFAGQHRIQAPLVADMGYHPYPAISAQTFVTRIEALLAEHAPETNLAQFNLLGSHDTARLLSIFDGDRERARLATLLLLTLPGAPSIYYGDEIGLTGGKEPGSRAAFPWDRPATWDEDALAYHRQFIALRHALPALRQGDFRRVFPILHEDDPTNGCVAAFLRTTPAETVLVAVNIGDEDCQIAPQRDMLGDLHGQPDVLLGTSDTLTPQDERIAITLPPCDGVVVAWRGAP